MNNTQSSCIYKAARRIRVEEECTLPDYCSDIQRVIRAEATPCITSKKVYVRDGILLCDISGRVYFNITYLNDRGGTEGYSFTSELFDSLKADAPVLDLDSLFAFASAQGENISCKVQSPRRLGVRADICIRLDVRANLPFDCYERGSDSVEADERLVEVMSIKSFKDEDIRITEEIKLPKSCPSMERILSVGLTVSLENVRASDNSVSFWGNAGLSCLYLPEEGWEGNGVQSFYQPIELKGSIEVDDSSSDCVALAQLIPLGVEYEILPDALGESRVLKADIGYSVQCLVEGNSSVKITEDIYGVGCKATPTYDKREFSKYIGALREDTAIKERLPLKRELSGVEGMEARVTLKETYFEGGELFADCRVNVTGIGISDDEPVAVSEVFDITVRLNLPAEVSGMSEGLTLDIAQWTGFTDSAVSGNELSVSFDLVTTAHIYKSEDVMYVASVTTEEREAGASGVVFYYPAQGDTLWTVGKRYGVSRKDLAHSNSVSDDKLPRVMVINPII